jgi:hypothetical protein
MPLTPTQLKAQTSSDLRNAFNEFLTLPVREEFVRKRLAVPLFSRHEAALDLGDGANISGLDTAKDLSYNEIIQKVNTQILPLNKHIAEPKFMDAGLELGGFKVQFEQRPIEKLSLDCHFSLRTFRVRLSYMLIYRRQCYWVGVL